MSQETKKKPMKTSFGIPFVQFDLGDHSADTMYLSFEEQGAYWNLLKRYYTAGPFDNDMKALQRVTQCPMSMHETMQNILEEFFYLSEEDSCWHHKRCDEEIRRVKGISEVQSKRARKGISERKRNPDTGQFISSPAGAGQSPAIKEEEVIVKEIINKEEINEDLIIEELRQNLMIDKELYID